jgi:cobalt ECF transporter T component CbiQ
MNFIERTLTAFTGAMEHSLGAAELTEAKGFLQHLDARTKLVGLLSIVVAAATARRLWVIGVLFASALVLAAGSRISLASLLRRVWLPLLVFTGIIALPALFVTPGAIVGRLPWLGWPLTTTGLHSAGFLVTRVETTATLSVLLILTTPWNRVLKALRVFRVPLVLVVILGMTYRYIFLLLESAQSMLESRRSRAVGELSGADGRRVAAATIGVLISKTFDSSNEVYSAMLARGFRGEVYVLEDFHAAFWDWLTLGIFLSLSAGAIYCGR